MVARLVEVQMGEYAPQSLWDDIDNQGRELDSAHLRLHSMYMLFTYTFRSNLTINSEARRKMRLFREATIPVNRFVTFQTKMARTCANCSRSPSVS